MLEKETRGKRRGGGGPRRSQELNVKGTEEHEREAYVLWRSNRDLVLINSPRSLLD